MKPRRKRTYTVIAFAILFSSVTVPPVFGELPCTGTPFSFQSVELKICRASTHPPTGWYPNLPETKEVLTVEFTSHNQEFDSLSELFKQHKVWVIDNFSDKEIIGGFGRTYNSQGEYLNNFWDFVVPTSATSFNLYFPDGKEINLDQYLK